jgi:PAS domain S-box-containing protein
MAESLHRKLVEEATDIMTVIDADGTITWVSPSVEQTLGYDPEDLIGEVGYEYQHPDDRAAVSDAIEQLQVEPENPQVVETRFRQSDGSWRWLEATLQNRFDDETIEGILVVSRDISERKSQQQDYRELAQEYKTLLETVQDGIFFLSVDPDDPDSMFRFERLNQAYEEQTGITTEEIQGKTPRDVFGDELGSELEANYQRCMRLEEPISYEEKVPVETGAQFWQTNLAPVITVGDTTRIIGITRDVTERVKRERQLRNQKEQLDEFASVVSHDLRNPLNVAQARITLLAEEYENEHIPPVEDALDRMEELITDTLTLARQGQVVSETEPVRLIDLVGKCWQTVSTADATIEIVDEVTIEGDRSRLQHVFENLFRNAIEHGGSGLTVRVGQHSERGLYVEDTGSGIPDEIREEVFEPGYTSETDGTGFGLTIVKRIAEAHGWDVSIETGTEGGARFEFTNVEFA